MPSNPLESHILNFIGLIYSGLFKRCLSGEQERDDKRGGVDVKLSRLSSVLSNALAARQGAGCLICSTFIIYLLRISNKLEWGDSPFLSIPLVIKVRWYQRSVSMSPDGWVTIRGWEHLLSENCVHSLIQRGSVSKFALYPL